MRGLSMLERFDALQKLVFALYMGCIIRELRMGLRFFIVLWNTFWFGRRQVVSPCFRKISDFEELSMSQTLAAPESRN